MLNLIETPEFVLIFFRILNVNLCAFYAINLSWIIDDIWSITHYAYNLWSVLTWWRLVKIMSWRMFRFCVWCTATGDVTHSRIARRVICPIKTSDTYSLSFIITHAKLKYISSICFTQFIFLNFLNTYGCYDVCSKRF